MEFKQSFQEVCQNNPDLTRIALDFSETKFMDNNGIGALVASRKMAQKTGFNLVLQNVPAQVMSALSLADLDKFFVIEQGVPSVFSSGSMSAPKPTDLLSTPSQRLLKALRAG